MDGILSREQGIQSYWFLCSVFSDTELNPFAPFLCDLVEFGTLPSADKNFIGNMLTNVTFTRSIRSKSVKSVIDELDSGSSPFSIAIYQAALDALRSSQRQPAGMIQIGVRPAVVQYIEKKNQFQNDSETFKDNLEQAQMSLQEGIDSLGFATSLQVLQWVCICLFVYLII